MESNATLGRITVTLTAQLLERLERLKARHSCSTSAIVEIAVRNYIGEDSEDQVGVRLRSAGAVRRRAQGRRLAILGGNWPQRS
jgi:metal-responsive CopG/Arc/MetJ family transcriptional regulator